MTMQNWQRVASVVIGLLVVVGAICCWQYWELPGHAATMLTVFGLFAVGKGLYE